MSELDFNTAIFERASNKCQNCGSHGPLSVALIVPEHAGGHKVASNAAALCRKCDLSRDAAPKLGEKAEDFVVSVWMSRSLRDQVESLISTKNTFSSWSSLSRYFIHKYLASSHLFYDLENYQDPSSETKVTIRVDRVIYDKFLEQVRARGMTATDALRGFYLMWIGELGFEQ